MRIPVEFELPGDRVLIHREDNKLILEPMSRTAKLVELLAEWRQEPPLELQDALPVIEDMPATANDMFLKTVSGTPTRFF